MRTLKIVILSSAFMETLEYQENLLVRYYQKYGHEVHVITSTNRSLFDYVSDRHDRTARREVYRYGHATIYRLPYRLNLLNRVSVFENVTPILDEVEPDLIFVRDILPNIVECAHYVRRHPRCKMILDFHADYSNSGNSWLSRKVLHSLLRKSVLDVVRPQLSRIFPVTPGGADFLRDLYGVREDEMEVLPLGADVDTAEGIRRSSAREELRREYRIPEDAIVIFTGGKLEPLKRTDALIKAFCRLPKGNAYLFIVGEATNANAPYKQRLVRLCQGRDDIFFTGWLKTTDIYRHFAASDFAVFPANQSILWQQAIAMHLPLVVGEMAKARQDISYLNKNQSIYILEQTNPFEDSVLRALETLIGNSNLRTRMSKGAAITTSEMLDWNVLIQRTLRFNFESTDSPNQN